MACGLSCVGVVWSLLSFISMGLACVGFFLPYWISGTFNGTPTSINSFRRCNYPVVSPEGSIKIIEECGHYTTFLDIPCLWWQVCTVLVGVGCGLLVVVWFTALLGCCMTQVVTRCSSKLIGSLQMAAALLIGAGCVVYPLGWDNPEVKQICGSKAEVYHLGHCTLAWAYYATIAGAGTALFSSLLSCHSPRSPAKRKQETLAHHNRHDFM